ncbi:MAG: hypothetical protein HUJ76_11815 [Parasporobacterium sp.]|nr:hypothetical protein [Parasporobacterium sp.]
MSRTYFTDDQEADLRINPYTAYAAKNKVIFTLAFKKLVLENVDKPGMTTRKCFALAGYDADLYPNSFLHGMLTKFRREAASPGGLKEPVIPTPKVPKKHSEAEYKALEKRVEILEQEMEFLKKSQYLKRTGKIPPASTSG